jgi:hypothetical protein
MFGLLNNPLGCSPNLVMRRIVFGNDRQSTLLVELIYHCYRDYSYYQIFSLLDKTDAVSIILVYGRKPPPNC